MKIVALPVSQDTPLFTPEFFHNHQEMTAQELADMVNAMFNGILAVGEENVKEIYKAVTTGKLFGG